MKKTFLPLFLLLVFVLSACGQFGEPTPIPTVALEAPSLSSADNPTGTIVTASAEIVPVDKVELSFPLTGLVTSVNAEVGETVTAGQTLATLDTTILEANIAEAEAAVLAAETQVRYLRRVGAGAEQIDKAQADVDRAMAVVDRTKATLAQTVLTAPISGSVVTLDIAPGETATPGRIVVVIANLVRLRVETTDLSERDIPAVEVGQEANIFIEALNENFSGRVVDIARQATTVGGDVVYAVTIEFDDQPRGLRWGMSAEVDIQTE